MFKVGDKVLKHSGDYQLEGQVVAVFQKIDGKTRYVVEHYPGILHIYSENNIKHLEKTKKWYFEDIDGSCFIVCKPNDWIEISIYYEYNISKEKAERIAKFFCEVMNEE